MHVDRAVAEEQLLGDLAVRPPDGDEAQDLELAPGQPPPRRAGRGALAESLGDRLAQCRDLAGRLGGQRAGAELARRAVGVAEAVEAPLALARRGEGDPGAELDLGALEGDLQLAVEVDRAAELLGRGLGVAVEQGGLADRVCQRRERVGVPVPRTPSG